MPWFAADLHLHSCLSPCGDLEASPSAIAATARRRGLDLIALTDHNSALNAPAFAECCRREGIAAVYGLEATCAEEAHCLCLFADAETARAFGELVYSRLVPVANEPERWGDQLWVNADDEIEGEAEYLLISATDIPLDELGQLVHARGGLFIPAHVDRAAFSLMSQLGFVPPGDYDALETYRELGHHAVRLKPRRVPTDLPAGAAGALEAMGETWPAETALPALICDSDAHNPDDIGQRHFRFWADRPDFAGLREALAHGWVIRRFSPSQP
jgi:PHP family Zn ribbon phosphoesterase